MSHKLWPSKAAVTAAHCCTCRCQMAAAAAATGAYRKQADPQCAMLLPKAACGRGNTLHSDTVLAQSQTDIDNTKESDSRVRLTHSGSISRIPLYSLRDRRAQSGWRTLLYPLPLLFQQLKLSPLRPVPVSTVSRYLQLEQVNFILITTFRISDATAWNKCNMERDTSAHSMHLVFAMLLSAVKTKCRYTTEFIFASSRIRAHFQTAHIEPSKELVCTYMYGFII